MKMKRFAILLTVAALVLALGMTGCTGGCSTNNNMNNSSSYPSSGNSGSSGSMNGSSNYGSSGSMSGSSGVSDPMSSIPDMVDDIMDDITDGDRLPDGSSSSAPLPGSGSSSSQSSGSQNSRSRSSSSSSRSSATTTMGTDFGEIGALSAKALNWGPGGPRDEKNRSQGAILYNQKFGKYDALFLADDQPVVYMTFDEGYENGLTPTFLATLKEKEVKGLFFITYDFANRQPELVRQIIEEGHLLGNHSWSHKNYGTLTPKQAAEDLMKMHDYIKENFGYEMKYFRFPSGNFNEQSLAVVQSMGYKSVFWSYAYKDWLTDDQPVAAESEDKLVKAVCPGNIYLLHAVSSTNAQVMGSFIDRVRDAGYTWGDPGTL